MTAPMPLPELLARLRESFVSYDDSVEFDLDDGPALALLTEQIDLHRMTAANPVVAATPWQRRFLARFVGRGWLSADRQDVDEQAAVKVGLSLGWLRHELSEAHFTPSGRAALNAEDGYVDDRDRRDAAFVRGGGRLPDVP
jgi:hypothetical protein